MRKALFVFSAAAAIAAGAIFLAGNGRAARDASPLPPNRLADDPSPYLRSAAGSPVRWQAYDDTAFALARRLGRPILLDIGAVWCHWCHVMDEEVYADPEVAALANERFVPVKVDRDFRPDLDDRYQAMAHALEGHGGWPLTAFLTPEGEPIWIGTFVPRDAMREILVKISEWYAANRNELPVTPGALLSAIEVRRREVFPPGPLDGKRIREILERIDADLLAAFDPARGGFGTGAKFPFPPAMDYALLRYDRTNRPDFLDVVRTTLEAIFTGGVYDHLGSGMHRYAVDSAWTVPHFEKMLADNAGLLENLAGLYLRTRDPKHAGRARDVLRFLYEMELPDGGFAASVDADVTTGDDGSYYTWSVLEAQTALGVLPNLPGGDTLAWLVAARAFDIEPAGEMKERPGENVLRLAKTPAEVAAELGIPTEDAEAAFARAKEKLLAARRNLVPPRRDETVYPALVGRAAAALLSAYEAFGETPARDAALRALDATVRRGYRRGEGFVRAIAEGRPVGPPGGWLDDEVQMLFALVRAYRLTGHPRYRDIAEDIARNVLPRFADESAGGWFDVPAGGPGPALSVRAKRIDDNAGPAPNAVAARALLLLADAPGVSPSAAEEYRAAAHKALSAFSGRPEAMGRFAATYGIALMEFESAR